MDSDVSFIGRTTNDVIGIVIDQHVGDNGPDRESLSATIQSIKCIVLTVPIGDVVKRGPYLFRTSCVSN